MTAVVAALLAPFALLTAFFVIEVIAGLRRSSRPPRRAPASAVVLIPAHDEAAIIAETLRRLSSALGEGMRALLVADNCSDSTAEQARAAGVDVIERNDPDHRGKGHAIAFAAEQLAADPPDVLVVLDADCEIDRPSLEALVASTAASGRPSQAINLLRADRSASPLVQLSTFAFMLKNLIRQRGLQGLAGRVHLTGTGMAMPFETFRASTPVRTSIVEDLALGLELADQGHPPQLVENAFVWSGASGEQGTLVQRRRWEGGFLATSFRLAPRMLGKALARADLRAAVAGLDLMVPPLALFALLNMAALTAAAALTLVSGAAWWPVAVQVVLLTLAALSVLAAWVREGRDFISFAALARIPLYVLWKLPLYVGLARRGTPKEWLRTGR